MKARGTRPKVRPLRETAEEQWYQQESAVWNPHLTTHRDSLSKFEVKMGLRPSRSCDHGA